MQLQPFARKLKNETLKTARVMSLQSTEYKLSGFSEDTKL